MNLSWAGLHGIRGMVSPGPEVLSWEGKALGIINSELIVLFIFHQFPKLGKFRTPKVPITHQLLINSFKYSKYVPGVGILSSGLSGGQNPALRDLSAGQK